MNFRWLASLRGRRIAAVTINEAAGAIVRDIDTTDLLQSATAYTDLAAQTTQLDPQTVAEIERIHDTHGPMGYSTAMGIAIGLTNTTHTDPDDGENRCHTADEEEKP